MKKESISKICFNVFKYIILLVPILILAVTFCLPNKVTRTDYAQNETRTEIVYRYQTNEVNSVDNLIVGNVYTFEFGYATDDYIIGSFGFDFVSLYLDDSTHKIFNENFYFDFDIFVANYYQSSFPNFYIEIVFSNDEVFDFSGSNMDYQSLERYANIIYDDYFIDNFGEYIDDFVSDGYLYESSLDFNSHWNIIETNYITEYDTSSPIGETESREANLSLINIFNDWYDLPINVWYNSIISFLEIDRESPIIYYFAHYPIWILYSELLFLIARVFAFIPMLLNKLFDRSKNL